MNSNENLYYIKMRKMRKKMRIKENKTRKYESNEYNNVTVSFEDMCGR